MGWREYQDSTPGVLVVKVAKETGESSHKPLIPLKPQEGNLKKQVDDRDLFVSGLNEYERIAYTELVGIMTSDGSTLKTPWTPEEAREYRLSPEQAHLTAKAIIERYRKRNPCKSELK